MRQPCHGRDAARRAALRTGAATALLACAVPAAAQVSPELDDLLARARGALPAQCAQPHDALADVLCRGELRVGARGDYPPFGVLGADGPRGFEPALARLLAQRLGVRVRFTVVDASNRMTLLGERRVDVLVASTGHTLQRDGQALFVLPHYYASHTVVVASDAAALRQVDGLPAMAGHTVCVTIGNATNAELALHGARLLLLASARSLVDAVRDGACALAAHDDSLLVPILPPGYTVRARFAPLPWGAVVRRDGGATLARALGLALRALHADGGLRRLAKAYAIDTPWLQAQQARWSAPPCRDAPPDAVGCVERPYDSALAPTPIAGSVARLEGWLAAHGVPVTLAMLKTAVAWRLFLDGVGYSIALAAGAVLATLGIALGFGAGFASRRRALRWPLHGFLLAMQSTPPVLLMSAAGVALSSAGPCSPAMLWLAAVLVLGLSNGSNAGQAVAEARASLAADGLPSGLVAAARRARAQLAAFAVNATRATPLASLIGVPELLAAQTDIASFSSQGGTTFAILLLFYMALVSLVVALLRRAQGWLRNDGAPS